jgi:hypothetical protein
VRQACLDACLGKRVVYGSFFEGGYVESTLGFQTRREVLLQMAPRYQRASAKGALLNKIAATIGHARRHAMELLNHPAGMQQIPRECMDQMSNTPCFALGMLPPAHSYLPIEGYTNAVNSAAWSPDSKRIASISVDITVQLWLWVPS